MSARLGQLVWESSENRGDLPEEKILNRRGQAVLARRSQSGDAGFGSVTLNAHRRRRVESKLRGG